MEIRSIKLINKKTAKIKELDSFMFDKLFLFGTKYSLKLADKGLILINIPLSIVLASLFFSKIHIFMISAVILAIVYFAVLYIYGNIISIWIHLETGWTFVEPEKPEVQEFIKKWKFEKYIN